MTKSCVRQYSDQLGTPIIFFYAHVAQGADVSISLSKTGAHQAHHGTDSQYPVTNRLKNQNALNKSINNANISSSAFERQNSAVHFTRGNLGNIQTFGFNQKGRKMYENQIPFGQGLFILLILSLSQKPSILTNSLMFLQIWAEPLAYLHMDIAQFNVR